MWVKKLRFSLVVTTMDRIRNEFITATAQVGQFYKVREARLRWSGQVQRRDSGCTG